jgi:hypothetical protein
VSILRGENSYSVYYRCMNSRNVWKSVFVSISNKRLKFSNLIYYALHKLLSPSLNEVRFTYTDKFIPRNIVLLQKLIVVYLVKIFPVFVTVFTVHILFPFNIIFPFLLSLHLRFSDQNYVSTFLVSYVYSMIHSSLPAWFPYYLLQLVLQPFVGPWPLFSIP